MKCECGCVDRTETRSSGEQPRVIWRYRDGLHSKSLGQVQASLDMVVCTECYNAWDDFVLEHPAWGELRMVQAEVRRMEIEGTGQTILSDWERKIERLYGYLVRLRKVAREWLEERKRAVAKANEAAGVKDVF